MSHIQFEVTLQLKGYLYDSQRYHLDCWAKIIKILVFIFYIFYFTKTQFSITICQKLYALMHLETSEKFDKFISYQGEKRQFLSSHCHSVKGTAVIRERKLFNCRVTWNYVSSPFNFKPFLIRFFIQVGIPHNSKQRNFKENN